MHFGLVFLRVGNEATCPTSVQEPASVPQRVESWDFGQTLQPSSNMSGCLQVSHKDKRLSLCAKSFRLHCAVCVVCHSPQRAAFSVQELCDANAVLGPAAPPGSCVIMGQQSEVSHDQCWKLKRQLISTVHIGMTFIVSPDGTRVVKGSVTFHWFILFAIWNRSKN